MARCGRSGAHRLVGFAGGLLLFCGAAASSATELGEARIVSVREGSGAQAAGVLPGDVIVRWLDGEGRHGSFLDPFGPSRFSLETVPRGGAAWTIRRGDEVFDVPLSPRFVGALTLPAAAPWDDAEVLLQEEALDFENVVEGADRLARDLGPRAAAYLWVQAAHRFVALDDQETGLRCLRRASGLVDERSWSAALVAHWSGMNLGDLGRLDDAEKHLREALDVWVARGDAELMRARTLSGLGVMMGRRGNMDEAEVLFEEALGITDVLGPRSSVRGDLLNNLALVARFRGDLEAAVARLREVLQLNEALDARDLSYVRALNNLGGLMLDLGDFAEAERLFSDALERRRRLGAATGEIAGSLNNLATVAERRGDLREAERWFLEALALRRESAPGSDVEAQVLSNLAEISYRRGHLATARAYGDQAIAILRRVAPGSPALALTLERSGRVAKWMGERSRAEDRYREALELHSAISDRSPETGNVLRGLARLVADRGDLQGGLDLARRSLELERELSPGSLGTSQALETLGSISRFAGNFGEARRRLEEALELRRRLIPSGSLLVSVLADLARLARDEGNLEEARDLFREALDQVEVQSGQAGGDFDTVSRLHSRYRDVAVEAIALALELGDPTEAFEIEAAQRSRGLSRLLAERRLELPDLDPELRRDLEKTDREARSLRNRLQKLDSLGAAEHAEVLRGQLSKLQERQRELRSLARDRSPRLVSLAPARDVSFSELVSGLPPGTVTVTYVLGSDEGWAFVAERHDEKPRVIELAGRRTLGPLVEALGEGLRQSSRRTARLRATLERLASALIRPVMQELEDADRIVLFPDRALEPVPFGALPVPGKDRGRRLVDRWTLSRATSWTSSGSRRESLKAESGLMIFADPARPGSVPAAASRGRGGELPGARAELAELQRLLPTAQSWVGSEVTEALVEAKAPEATVLHFATHGVLDERTPLDSALLLTPTEEDDGALRAWEVLENLELKEALVVLSACDSASGDALGAEGTLGLGWSFLAAGARAVVASRWKVDDEATAELMGEFYRGLKKGLPVDEALRSAQVAMAGGPNRRWRASRYWAAFSVLGDGGMRAFDAPKEAR